MRETQNIIAWETRKFYYTHLYASSLVPTLEQAETYAQAALNKAQELYDAGTGEVAQSDLSRLKFSLAQVHRFQVLAINGASVALVALKHTMGLASNANLKVADTALSPITEEPRRELSAYIADAANNRPEWQQLAHGKAATKALGVAEIKANLPVLAIAGQFGADWAPTRDNAENPYWNDQYNRLTGGLALALIFDINPWMAQAKADTAEAQFEQLEALERFASTGIPLQVLNAWVDLEEARRIVDIAGDAIQATRKWTTFAANAYDTGTGEPRDLLEGLAAMLESRRMYYDALRDFYLAKAELLYSTGTH
ncbi:MAG: TolC family protein [Clostridia bacterium]|nr:TolC family protein [Deltaproteobacteria bacterium]